MKNYYDHSVKDYYERFWEKTEVPKDYKYKVSIIKELVSKQLNIKVLDYGCGKATFTKDLLSVNPSLNITGVDISQIAIESAKKIAPKQKFYVISEGERLPFKDNSFDFIFALDVFLYVYDTGFIFKELSRLLKPKGKILITLPYYGVLKNIAIALIGFETVYNPRNAEIRFYTKKNLLKEIKSVGLIPIKFGYFGRFYPFSNGMYAVAQK